jgi:uncharacterized phage-associated protein
MENNKENDKIQLVAQYFIEKAQSSGKNDLSNKKLQKLLYYSQAWNLVLNKQKLVDDDFEAWIHGPANRKIYNIYKIFGFQPIKQKVHQNWGEIFSDKEIELLNSVWDVYGKYDAQYLELLTHSEDPWIETRRGLEPFDSCTNVINIDLMKQFYGEKIKEAKE